MHTDEFKIPEFTDEHIQSWFSEEEDIQADFTQHREFVQLNELAEQFVDEFFEVNPNPSKAALCHFLAEGIKQAAVENRGPVEVTQVYFYHTVAVLVAKRLFHS